MPESTPVSLSQIILDSITDFPRYAREYLKIQTKKGSLVPLELNEVQQLLEDIIADIRRKGRLIRMVILKARRKGVSTWVSGRFYHKTTTNANRYSMIVTHEPEATDFVFKMHKRFQEHVPEFLRPQERYNNRKVLEFNDDIGRGLDSAIRVGTAGKEDFGSAQLIHYLHLCMHPDTPIILKDGRERLLRDVVIGDSLVTHNGNYGRVEYSSSKDSSQMPSGNNALKISSWLSNSPIIVSPEHKIDTNMGWVRAKDLDPKWQFLSMPIRKITDKIKHFDVDLKSRTCPRVGVGSIPTSEDIGYFMGYYLAEGHVKEGSKNFAPSAVIFALDQDEERFALRAVNAVSAFFKKPPTFKTRKNSRTKMITINSTALAQVVERLFGRTAGKYIPDWVFDCGEDFCRGLVAGYLSGDGSKTIGGKTQKYGSNAISATSIHDSITYQIRDLVAALGYGWGNISYKKGGVYYGRNCSPTWIVYFNGECGYKLRKLMGIPYAELQAKSFIAQKYYMDFQHSKVWIRIKNIQPVTCDKFIDLEIDHADHSLRTTNFSVSNSELAKYPKHVCTNLLLSLLQCVPETPDSEILIESTAKGVGGEFYDRYFSSRYKYIMYLGEDGKPTFREETNEQADPDNDYTSIFIPWFVFDEYQMDVRVGFIRTPEEDMLAKAHGLTDRQLQWRRWTIANKCDSKIELFNQEYPATDLEAFLSASDNIFDLYKLDNLKKAALPPKQRYDIQMITGNVVSVPEKGCLRVWEEPKAGLKYVIAADVAEGLDHGDFSSADIVSVLTGKQVAQWHGKIDPDQFGFVLACLGLRYNKAFMVVERNNHGLTTLESLTKFNYSNLYAETIVEPPHRPRKRYGWLTTKKSKPMIIDHLIGELRDNLHGINCRDTFDEMMTFKQFEDGSMGAEQGRCDDRVISIAIGKYVADLESSKLRKAPGLSYNKSPVARQAPAVSSRAWT